MDIKKVLISIFLCFLFMSCVSKGSYITLQSNLLETQKRFHKENSEKKNAEDGLLKTEKMLKECNESLNNIKTLYGIIQDQDSKLGQEVEGLKAEVEKTKSVQEEQEKLGQKLDETKNALEIALKGQIENNEVKLEKLEGKLRIVFFDKILFAHGSLKISQKGKSILLKIASYLNNSISQEIFVQSYTNNWEISASKAASVIRFLQEKGEIESNRLLAVGHKLSQKANDNEEDNKRRIEVILFKPK